MAFALSFRDKILFFKQTKKAKRTKTVKQKTGKVQSDSERPKRKRSTLRLRYLPRYNHHNTSLNVRSRDCANGKRALLLTHLLEKLRTGLTSVSEELAWPRCKLKPRGCFTCWRPLVRSYLESQVSISSEVVVYGYGAAFGDLTFPPQSMKH